MGDTINLGDVNVAEGIQTFSISFISLTFPEDEEEEDVEEEEGELVLSSISLRSWVSYFGTKYHNLQGLELKTGGHASSGEIKFLSGTLPTTLAKLTNLKSDSNTFYPMSR